MFSATCARQEAYLGRRIDTERSVHRRIDRIDATVVVVVLSPILLSVCKSATGIKIGLASARLSVSADIDTKSLWIVKFFFSFCDHLWIVI